MPTLIRALCSVGLLIAIFSSAGGVTVAAADKLCFTETGQCISGRFLTYWEQNGGLAVFGYPTTLAQHEVNRENKQAYLTQWFERNRFELHPENNAPYDVLLGRLGDDSLRMQGKDWQTSPHPDGSQPGCLWFVQTSHMVCDQDNGLGFKSYWEQHGLQDSRLNMYGRSLALFGLPLTEATVEVSPTNGQPYLTQWFERARFEWHPDEPDEYKVLLGLLGNEVRAGQSASNSSAARLLTSTIIGSPATAGHTLFWIDGRTSDQPIYRYDLDSQTTTLAIAQAATKRSLTSDGQTLAWIEDGSQGISRVQGYTLNGRHVFSMIDSAEHKTLDHIVLNQGTLYYYDSAEGHRGIFARTLATNQERLVTTGSNDFIVGDTVLLWNEERFQNGIGPAQVTLHLVKLDDSQGDTVVVQDQGEGRSFGIASDTVVWNYAGGSITLYNVNTQSTQTIAGASGFYPVITPTTIFWTDVAETTHSGSTVWPLVGYSLSTGVHATLATVETPSLVHVWAVVDQTALAYTTSTSEGGTALYLLPLP